MGCGKGRVLLLASQYGFQKVKGIEFAEELCQIALVNCKHYQKYNPMLNYEIIHSDVVNYPIQEDENVFYMFNAFGKDVLIEMLNNIITSTKIKPRKVLIIYYHPSLSYVIESYKEFNVLEKIKLSEGEVSIYKNY